MNLLVLNSKVDRADSGLEVASEWIDALASRVTRIDVITNHAGVVSVADNVTVSSLGFEHRRSRIARVAVFYRHLRRILRERPVDACFVHMVPQFGVLAAPLLVPRRIPMVQWYTHRSAPLALRLSHALSHRVVSASAESFSLPSRKLTVTGHGINVERFRPGRAAAPDAPPRILTAGRLSASKRLEILLEAMARLRQRGVVCHLDIVGEGRDAAGLACAAFLRTEVERLGLAPVVTFHGPVTRADIVAWYQRARLFVNLSDTDSIDKAVLEAMACGVPVLTSNRAFAPLLADMPDLLVRKSDPEGLSLAMERLLSWNDAERRARGARLRGLVETHHDLNRLADRLVDIFEAVAAEHRGRS